MRHPAATWRGLMPSPLAPSLPPPQTHSVCSAGHTPGAAQPASRGPSSWLLSRFRTSRRGKAPGRVHSGGMLPLNALPARWLEQGGKGWAIDAMGSRQCVQERRRGGGQWHQAQPQGLVAVSCKLFRLENTAYRQAGSAHQPIGPPPPALPHTHHITPRCQSSTLTAPAGG